jgi:predicted transcriptional regulator
MWHRYKCSRQERPVIQKLPPRERQILEALYTLGEGAAAEVRERLESPPSYSAVRAMLVRLEAKGFVTHREQDQRYVYAPVVARAKAEQTALRQVVSAFFDNSPARAATALLGMPGAALSGADLDALEAMIAQAREARLEGSEQ